MRLIARITVGVRRAGAAETDLLPPGSVFDAPKAEAEALIAAGVAIRAPARKPEQETG